MKNVKKSWDLASLTREELKAKVMRMSMQLEELSSKLAWYEEQYKLSRAQRFGPSSEHTPFEQMSFFNEAESEMPSFMAMEPKLDEVNIPSKKKAKGHKAQITGSLPTKVIEYKLSSDECVCPQCGGLLHEMKKEVHRELTVISAQVTVTERLRYVYACRNCDKNETSTPIISAPMPKPVIKNSLASPSMVAHIMQRKYVDAVPLYRQEQQFKKYGLMLSRQTLANWMIKSANDWLRQMYNLMHKELIKREVLHADETVLEVLCEPGREATTNSYMWVYRTGLDSVPIVLYDYTQGRSGDYAVKYSHGFKGYFNTDAYAGYHKLSKNHADAPRNVTLVGCWAHARRKYDEALKGAGDKSSNAAYVTKQGLEYCNTLFRLEQELKNLSFEERYIRRKNEAEPVVSAYFEWAKEYEKKVLPKSLLGKSIAYSLNQEEYLRNYLLDGRLELSNNRAERAIKPFVIGHKNWLFSNTPRGAEASAIIYSLIETAKENDLNPIPYLQYLFEQLPNVNMHDERALIALLPWSKELPKNCRNLTKQQ